VAPPTLPGPLPSGSVGFAPRSQWRDRAGLAPASLADGSGSARPPPPLSGHLEHELFDWARVYPEHAGSATSMAASTKPGTGQPARMAPWRLVKRGQAGLSCATRGITSVRRVHLGLMVLLVATGCQRSFGTAPA